jgi:hypothetical protein
MPRTRTPVGPPTRRKTSEMGIHEIIPPALQYTSDSPEVRKQQLSQPGNAMRIPYGQDAPRGALGYWQATPVNGIALAPGEARSGDEETLPHETAHAMWNLGTVPKFVQEQWKHIHVSRLKRFNETSAKYAQANQLADAAGERWTNSLPAGFDELPEEQQEALMDTSPLFDEYNRLYVAAEKMMEELRLNAPVSAITKYSQDPEHSWAELVGQYVGTPEKLETEDPTVYNWMRSVMGREYKQRTAEEAADPAAQVPFYWGSVR